MVRSSKRVKMLVNLSTSVAVHEAASICRRIVLIIQGCQVREFHLLLSGRIRQQVFYVNLVQNIEIHIKSSIIIKALKQLCLKQMG